MIMRNNKSIYIAIASILIVGIVAECVFAVWDATKPADSTIFRVADNLIRDNNAAIEAALNAQHVFVTGGAQTGVHREGACNILYYDTTANIDAGVIAVSFVHDGLMFDTDLDCFYTMNADNDAKVALVLGPTAIAGALLDEDDMVSDDATKAPSQQSTKAYVDSGTVTMTNKTLTTPTLTSPVIDTGVSGTAILDEDDMATDSNTQLATQQSIKAYVDTSVAAKGFHLSGTPQVFNTKVTEADEWQVLDLSTKGTPAIGANRVLVHLEVTCSTNGHVFVVSSSEIATGTIVYNTTYVGGNTVYSGAAGSKGLLTVTTDANGYIYIGSTSADPTWTVNLVGYVN